MPRTARLSPGGTLFHVLNRGVGRMQIFSDEDDEHFYAVMRYVERNALRAGLVSHAEDWRWRSLHQQAKGGRDLALAAWPKPPSGTAQAVRCR